MELLLTANVASNLYWLGRYLQRVETTLYKILKTYDQIIDVDADAGKALYDNFHIKLEYDNAMDFINQAILGEHEGNLYDVMGFARENAIISRPHLDAEAFGEIIELYKLFEHAHKSSEAIDYKFIDAVLSLVSEIWGATVKREHIRYSDIFFRLGKLVEELDFDVRFSRESGISAIVVNKIQAIFAELDESKCLSDEEIALVETDIYELFTIITKKIDEIIIL